MIILNPTSLVLLNVAVLLAFFIVIWVAMEYKLYQSKPKCTINAIKVVDNETFLSLSLLRYNTEGKLEQCFVQIDNEGFPVSEKIWMLVEEDNF